MFYDWEDEEDQDAFEANRRVEKKNLDQNFEDLRYEIEQEIIPHILEDVCPTCPIDAARTYISDFNVTTCDPRGYHANCGIAELRLRAKYLLARKEVR